jgi:hypothetical protein
MCRLGLCGSGRAGVARATRASVVAVRRVLVDCHGLHDEISVVFFLELGRVQL